MAVITVTNEYKAGGQRVALGVAEKLGFQFVGEQLVAEVARKLHVSKHEAETFLKPGSSNILRYLDRYTCSIVRRVVDREHGCLDDTAYYDKTRELVENIYKNEDAVILGWGAQCILGGKPDTFHVLLKKAPEKKIEQILAERGGERKTAEQAIRNDEQEKQAYMQKFFRVDWQDPSLYDLILDMGDYSTDAAVALVCEKARERVSPKKE